MAVGEKAGQQSFLLRLSDALRPLEDPAALESTACRMLGEYLSTNRVVSSNIDGDEFAIRQSWSRDCVPNATHGSLASFGKRLLGLHRRGEAIVVTDVATDARLTAGEQARLASFDIQAFVRFMQMKDDKPVGAFGVHQRTPRAWTETEIELVHEVAQRIWVAAEHARAGIALRKSEARLALELADMQVLQNISDHIVRDQNPQALFQMIADAAVLLMRSDASSVQKYDRPSGRLELVAYRGFHSYAATHWKWVSVDQGTACGRALRTGQRVVVDDITEVLAEQDRKGFQLSGLRAVQSTPLISHSGSVVGVLSTHRSDVHRPDEGAFRVFDVLARWAADLMIRAQIENDLRDSEARQKVLVAELQHRTRNIIAVVQSIAERSAATASSLEDFSDAFSRRLDSLARVQGLLSRADSEAITIGALVRMELDAVGMSGAANRIRLFGPEVPLRNAIVQMLALALHELTTNALKHGSLGNASGRLDITWELGANERLHLEWTELGLALSNEQRAPVRRGHGVELIEQALPYTLGARTSFSLLETGAVCIIDVPLDGPPRNSRTMSATSVSGAV